MGVELIGVGTGLALGNGAAEAGEELLPVRRHISVRIQEIHRHLLKNMFPVKRYVHIVYQLRAIMLPVAWKKIQIVLLPKIPVSMLCSPFGTLGILKAHHLKNSPPAILKGEIGKSSIKRMTVNAMCYCRVDYPHGASRIHIQNSSMDEIHGRS